MFQIMKMIILMLVQLIDIILANFIFKCLLKSFCYQQRAWALILKGMNMSRYNKNFSIICELFCHLAYELEKGENKDMAIIVDNLMYIWLDKTFKK